MGEYVVAVDVGTGSARAAVFDRKGSLIARAARPIVLRREDAVTAEHKSEDIWHAVVASVRQAVADSVIDPASVDAIGFDATCSLTFLGTNGKSLNVATDGEAGWDTIAWLDHRAIVEADRLSQSGSEALAYSGNVLSPEMQLPKILWVKTRLPKIWKKTAIIADLADFMTFRATGHLTRSASTLTAKWNYLNHAEAGWDKALLDHAGLGDLAVRAAIPENPIQAGQAVGTLSPEAARTLNLPTSCKVAAGMVDAYAGVLALTGAVADAEDAASLIGGTSSCVMRFSQEPHFIDAFWGPYFGAALPERWIIEGGQSAAGALLDHILRSHFGRDPTVDDHEQVLARIVALGPDIGKDIHILPDFHGSRTPHGNAALTGSVHGLTLDASFDRLCALYYRTKVSLALGIRQIVEKMEHGHMPIRRLFLGGGHAKSPLFAQLYADATGRDVVISSGEEAMLLGSAMTAASAAGWYPSLEESCHAMRRPETVIHPDPVAAAGFEPDYRIFLKMQDHRREIAELSQSMI